MNKKRNFHLKGASVKHCKNTAKCPIKKMDSPERVYIPMSQNIGAPAVPCVSVGEKVKIGKLIASSDAPMSAPIYASVSGEVEAIEIFESQSGKQDTHIVIKSDGKDEVEEGLNAPSIFSREDFLLAVRKSGLVGLGGAAFPMSIKYNVPEGKADYLILNGAECEPYITVDHRAMLEYGEKMIAGMRTTMKWLGIKHGVIGIEDNKKDAIANFRKILKDSKDIMVLELGHTYPNGAERVIIYEATGRKCAAGMLPIDVGCIVSNVVSMLKLELYLETGMPLVTKYITVDGNVVKNPQNLEVPIGTKVKDIVDYCGGVSEEPKKILLGGPMMGKAIPSMDYGIIKGNNAILLFDELLATKPKETACISCGRCASVCPMNLMPYKLSKAYKNKNIEELRKYNVLTCMDCGCCSYECPARKPLNFEFRLAKTLVIEDDKKRKEAK